MEIRYKLIKLIGIISLIPELLIAQYSNGYDWSNENIEPIAIDEHFSNNKAIILSEQNTISIAGKNEGSIMYYIKKKYRVKILKKEGLDKFKLISIPESFDPLYDYHKNLSLNVINKNKISCIGVKMKYFAARIIKPNGKIEDAKITKKDKKDKIILNKRYFNTGYFDFEISNLEIGDELEIAYRYELKNYIEYYRYVCNRLFFNGDIPKQNYSLTIIHDKNLDIDITYVNNANPDSIKIVNSKKYYFWNKTKLFGCIYEVGARPYKALPYLIVKIRPNSERYLYTPLNSLKAYMPYWNYNALSSKYGYGMPTSYDEYFELKDKQNLKLQKFVHTQTEDIPDTLNYLKLSKINQTITNDFKYKEDSECYKGNDIRLERLGEFTENKIIREISQYKFYQKIFYYLKLFYVKIYLIDNRVAKIDNEYIPSLFQNEYVFGVFFGNNIVFLCPKKSRYGYYLDEFPFYWENTQGLVITATDLMLATDSIKPIFITTPSSNIEDNVRRSSIIVNVDIDKSSVGFIARLFLSGQFSTVTRGLYLYDYKNEIINSFYNKTIYDDISGVHLITKDVSSIKASFPFNTKINLEYNSSDLLNINNDSTYSLNISNWFKHVIYKNMDINERQLDFYSDFLFRDTYTYLIKFDKDIELIKYPEQIEIKNNFGKLMINVEQIQPNTVKLSSYFAVLQDSVSVANINDVKIIYTQIQHLNEDSLIFRLK